jgi:uncharacterized protein YggE
MSEIRQPSTRLISLVALAVGAMALVAPSVLARPIATVPVPPAPPGAPGDPVSGITATGTAHVIAVPDEASFSVGVELQADSAAAALADAGAKMEAVIAALRSKGVAEQDLRTSNVSLAPVYDYSREGQAPRLVGYGANEQLTVTVRDIDDTGVLIDAAVTAGATTVSGVSFSVADPTKATDAARKAAVADAERRAEALAAAAGVRLGAPISIVETAATPPAPVYRELAAADGAVPIMRGTTEVMVQVVVVFAIG